MFGIAKTIKDNVQPCTSEKLNAAIDSPRVAEICASIAEALQKHQQGEMTKEEFEATKSRLKKQLPVITPHATFKNGRRKNDEAIPSGLAMYDIDHMADPRAKWGEIEPRKEELGIMLAHISPSTEGLRLIFSMQQGHTLAQAQAWMAQQLGDTEYDACVKDYARCSFLVPRAYVLYLDEGGLFNDDSSRHGLHGFHGTRPLPVEAFGHFDEHGNLQKSASSNQSERLQRHKVLKPCNPCNPCQKNQNPQRKHSLLPEIKCKVNDFFRKKSYFCVHIMRTLRKLNKYERRIP